jgi:AraC-like DNA-binding protein
MNLGTSMKHPPLVETHLVGQDTRERVLRASECPAFGPYHIAHVGVADAAEPYAMVRTELSGSYFLACFGGEGRILLDGRWQPCRAGQGCLAPAHVRHAFHAVPRRRWTFAWVRYDEHAGLGPLGAASAPVLAAFNAEAFRLAVEGLMAEQAAGGSPAPLHHWVELVHGYVAGFARPWHVEDRLARLWEAVASRPGDDWSLKELARRAHCSGEHLRRLCRRQLGRSPMQHVTHLRMRHGAALLAETDHKLEVIAELVGYANPFVFSNTFKRWTGWRPSDYRSKQRPRDAEKKTRARTPRDSSVQTRGLSTRTGKVA